MFQSGSGNWTQYRSQFNLSRSDEIDLHFGKRDRELSYWEAMAGVTDVVVAKLNEARRNGRSHVMFVHGASTSRPDHRPALRSAASCARKMRHR
jgi:hypothetical protein